MPSRVVVIGGGPMGIAAVLGALARGHATTLLEASDIGASLRSWGPTRFFTPFAMNVSPAMRRALGANAPADDAILTGPEYAERVLKPIADSDAVRQNVRINTRVTAIGRRGLIRTDYPGHPLRGEKPFRILTDADETLDADVVLDATGSSAIPLPFGAGGIPARGESRVYAIRTLSALDEARGALRGKRVLLVGHGHSAANALLVLRDAGAEVTWVVRTRNQRPCEEIANDPLPERFRVVRAANDAASEVRVERSAMVEGVAQAHDHVDAIVAMTGYRAAEGYTGGLALDLSPVTEGSARLYRAISKITDCLSVPAVAKSDLESGEPNYYLIGARAYGRSRTFLLQTGFQQLETILDSIPR
jgi:thioredoxin reductase